jgi:hypothetical protein
MPWTCVTIGTGPVYRPGVAAKIGRESRVPAPFTGASVPFGGFAQCSVGSTGSRWGRKLPLPFLSSLIHVTVVGVPRVASIVKAG